MRGLGAGRVLRGGGGGDSGAAAPERPQARPAHRLRGALLAWCCRRRLEGQGLRRPRIMLFKHTPLSKTGYGLKFAHASAWRELGKQQQGHISARLQPLSCLTAAAGPHRAGHGGHAGGAGAACSRHCAQGRNPHGLAGKCMMDGRSTVCTSLISFLLYDKFFEVPASPDGATTMMCWSAVVHTMPETWSLVASAGLRPCDVLTDADASSLCLRSRCRQLSPRPLPCQPRPRALRRRTAAPRAQPSTAPLMGPRVPTVNPLIRDRVRSLAMQVGPAYMSLLLTSRPCRSAWAPLLGTPRAGR